MYSNYENQLLINRNEPKYIGWATDREIEYLDNIGTSIPPEHQGFVKVEYLRGYLKAASSRANWGSINKLQVIRYATQLLQDAIDSEIFKIEGCK